MRISDWSSDVCSSDLIVRNTFKPEHPGTRLSRERQLDPPVKGVSIQPQMAVINIEGNGLIGVPGVAERVFGTLGAAGVSVVMISQGSSEHSICCVEIGRATSELQSLMRISYAVFCLKKKSTTILRQLIYEVMIIYID